MSTESPSNSLASSHTAQVVMVRLHELPLEQQQEVLDFVEFLIQKHRSCQSIWKEIKGIVEQVPEEQWDCLPTDGAQYHDHYLYGTPKTEE